MQKLLTVIRSIAGDVFLFQQDIAPAHRARDTVELNCAVRHRSSSVLTCNQPTLPTFFLCCRSSCVERLAIISATAHELQPLQTCTDKQYV